MPPRRPAREAVSRSLGGFRGRLLAILVAAVGVGLLVLWLRREPGATETAETASASRAAVEAAIGALDGETDPRRAVIAAYGAMQRTLGERGVVRSPAEAPREYLQRALVASRATEREARTLTGLFEEARYSTHPIPERLREVGAVRVAFAAASAAGGRGGVRLLAEIGLVVLARRSWSPVAWRSCPTRARLGDAGRAPAPARPDQLVALERLVVSAGTSAVHVHAYLRPLLVEIASRRLAARGQTLERMPDAAARELLGDRLWDIVRPGPSVPRGQARSGGRAAGAGGDAGGARAAVSGSLAPRTPGVLALAGAGLIASAGQRPPRARAARALPFLVFAGAGLVLAQQPHLAAEIELDRTRLLEGEEVVATVRVRNDGAGAVAGRAGTRTKHEPGPRAGRGRGGRPARPARMAEVAFERDPSGGARMPSARWSSAPAIRSASRPGRGGSASAWICGRSPVSSGCESWSHRYAHSRSSVVTFSNAGGIHGHQTGQRQPAGFRRDCGKTIGDLADHGLRQRGFAALLDAFQQRRRFLAVYGAHGFVFDMVWYVHNFHLSISGPSFPPPCRIRCPCDSRNLSQVLLKMLLVFSRTRDMKVMDCSHHVTPTPCCFTCFTTP